MVKPSIFTIKDIEKENKFIQKQLNKKGMKKPWFGTPTEIKIIEHLDKNGGSSQKQLLYATGSRSMGTLWVLLNKLVYNKVVEMYSCESCDSAKKFRLEKDFLKKHDIRQIPHGNSKHV